MHMLELSLLLLAAVLISSVVNQLVPRLSTPLVQIAMGLLIAALGAGQVTIDLDPELFLVLFIAPLLYDEARGADVAALWHHRWSVISYAIGLVLVIALCVGFALNALEPSIPLAAAFALGAALGPTDAVAVASVSKNKGISESVKSVLKGEALLNDASGLVSFQFAVAAVATGAFSAVEAGVEFAMSFFGGILLGVLCGVLINFFINWIRDVGYEDTMFNVLFEVFTPFMVFLLAEAINVSGIIAVVLCGVINVSSRRKNGPSLSRTSIVSSSVWEVLTFALNGIVFVLLGTQLPGAIMTTWGNNGEGSTMLVLMVLLVSVVLVVARFVWSAIAVFLEHRAERTRPTKTDFRDMLILTFSGAKGTITLSIMFTLPFDYIDAATGVTTAFPDRDLLIFVASGVIVVTLLLSTFVVPLLAPKQRIKESEQQVRESNVDAALDVLRNVIEELTERQSKGTFSATREVVAAYNDRIERMKANHDIEESPDRVKLRLSALMWQRDYIRAELAAGRVSDEVAERALDNVRTMERLIKHEGITAEIAQKAIRTGKTLRTYLHRTIKHLPVVDPSKKAFELRELQRGAYLNVVQKCEELMREDSAATEDIAAVSLTYQRFMRMAEEKTPSLSTMARVSDKADEIEALALRLELKYIQQMVDEERMTRAYARRMRENVAMMQIDLEDTV